MPMISVKAAPGRLVPRSVGGAAVPPDEFIHVRDSKWVRDRIAVGDLILEPPPCFKPASKLSKPVKSPVFEEDITPAA